MMEDISLGGLRIINLAEEYKGKIQAYERYTEKIEHLILELLKQEGVEFHDIESRTKSVESFEDKAKRRGSKNVQSLADIVDLSGVRIILYYLNDIDLVCDIIDKAFAVDQEASIDKKTLLSPDQFGYLSVHKIVSITGERANLPEWREFQDFKAEIQIRTVLQHSWAAISHILQYKREAEIPLEFRRKFTRLAGLLELVDEEFDALRSGQQALAGQIAGSIEKKNFDIPLDAISAAKYIEASANIELIVGMAKDAGIEFHEPSGKTTYEKLLHTADRIGLKTIGDLDEMLANKMDKLPEFIECYLRHCDDHTAENTQYIYKYVEVYNVMNVDYLLSIIIIASNIHLFSDSYLSKSGFLNSDIYAMRRACSVFAAECPK